MGATAARQLLDLPAASTRTTAGFDGDIFWRETQSEVAVAGLGTGGAVAALAAARQSDSPQAVLGFDPLSFCGGIGAGGGIHWYYFGVKGGLQEELDARQRDVMPSLPPPDRYRVFTPTPKSALLEAMLRESGAQLLFGATLSNVEVQDRRSKAPCWPRPMGQCFVGSGLDRQYWRRRSGGAGRRGGAFRT